MQCFVVNDYMSVTARVVRYTLHRNCNSYHARSGHNVNNSHTMFCAVASLGWVTLGAASEGVTPLLFPEKTWRPFLLIAVTITIAFYCFHSGVTPLEGVTPHLFYLSDLFSPLFFVNLPTKIVFSFGCHHPGGCHPGRSPRPT